MIFQTDSPYGYIIIKRRHIMKRRLPVSVRKGHHFQWKVYERSTFFVKSGI